MAPRPHSIWEDGGGGGGGDDGAHGHSHDGDGAHGHSHGPEAGEGSCMYRWRWVIARVGVRVFMVALIVTLIRLFPGPAAAAGTAVLNWINSLPGLWSPVVFCVIATAFCAVSPTGYMPAVAAGIAFPPQASIPITYISVNLGALLNVALVRGLCLGRLPQAVRLKYEARGEALLGTGKLGLALDAHPIGMVALLRLPFLANGALNYIFSMRSSLPVGRMTLGNLLGFTVGSVLFPMAGAQIRSLGELLAEGPGSGQSGQTTLGVFFGVSALVLIAAAAAYFASKRVLQRLASERTVTERAESEGHFSHGHSHGDDDGEGGPHSHDHVHGHSGDVVVPMA